MAIADDFAFDDTNRIISRGAVPSATVYTMNELYTHVQDTYDEPTQLDDPVPMSAATPTEYSIINGWYIRRECIPFLKGGGLATVGWDDDGTYDGDGVRILKLDASANLTSADIGKAVLGAVTGDTGTLLDYDTTLHWLWVRPDDSGDDFDNASEAITVDAQACGNMTAASVSGEAVWANIYSLGTIVDNTILYVVQDGVKLNHAWYTADYGSDKQSGHLDALINIQEAGSLIDSGDLIIYARRYGAKYDHFNITITTGSRNPIPLATSADLDNTTAEAFLFFDTETNGGFAAGDVIGDAATWASVTAHAVVVSVTDWGTEGVLALKNIHGTFSDNDDLYVVGSTQRGVANGTIGSIWLTYENEAGGPFTVGNTITSDGTGTPTGTIRGLQDDGATGKLCIQMTSGHIYDTDGLTEGGCTADASSDETEAVWNYHVDNELAQVCGLLELSGDTGTFEKYEQITGGSSGHTAIVIYFDPSPGAEELIVANATGQFQVSETITGAESGATATVDVLLAETTQDSDEDLNNGNGAQPYDIHIGMNRTEISGEKGTVARLYEWLKYITRRQSVYTIYDSDGTSAVTTIDGEQYIMGRTTWAPRKDSPFGYFAGGKFFGARGVWIEDMAAADVQAYQLTDSNNVTQTPPNLQSYVVTSLVSGDRVAVFPRSGSAVNKTQYTSHATNNVQSASTFEVTVAIPSDTPASGFITVVDDSAGEEHRYRYASWSGSVFTLITERTGSADADSSGDTLECDAASFVTWGVQVGDIIRNTTDGTWSYVASVVDEDTLTTRAGEIDWSNGDGFEIGSLVVAYGSSDTAYVPLILEEATGTSASVTVTYVTDRNVLVRVRKKGIIPFEIEQTFTSSGMSQAAIRTADTIVS